MHPPELLLNQPADAFLYYGSYQIYPLNIIPE